MKKLRRRFLNKVTTSVQNLTLQMIFSNHELHIILKRRNLKIKNLEHLEKQLRFLISPTHTTGVSVKQPPLLIYRTAAIPIEVFW